MLNPQLEKLISLIQWAQSQLDQEEHEREPNQERLQDLERFKDQLLKQLEAEKEKQP